MTTTVIDELLYFGMVDWMRVGEVAWIVETVDGRTVPDVEMDASLAAITTLLTDGLAEIGDVVNDPASGMPTFRSWELSADDAVRRVRTAWIALGRRPYRRELATLQLTPAGERRAVALEEARQADTQAAGRPRLNLTPAVRELLLDGAGDELDMAFSAQAVKHGTGLTTDAELREATLAAIETLLRHGLAEIGDFVPDPDGRTACNNQKGDAPVFVPWALSVDAVVARIRREWITLGRPPNLWEIAWLVQTSDGRRTAKALQPDRPRR